MRKLKIHITAAFALFTLLFLALATSAKAQGPGPSGYLQALSDLRMARAYVKIDHHPEFADQMHRLNEEIDRAIDEVKKCVRDDGANTNFTPPPQTGVNPRGVSDEIIRLLDRAYGNVTYGGTDPVNVRPQQRAAEHLGEARKILRSLIVQ